MNSYPSPLSLLTAPLQAATSTRLSRVCSGLAVVALFANGCVMEVDKDESEIGTSTNSFSTVGTNSFSTPTNLTNPGINTASNGVNPTTSSTAPGVMTSPSSGVTTTTTGNTNTGMTGTTGTTSTSGTNSASGNSGTTSNSDTTSTAPEPMLIRCNGLECSTLDPLSNSATSRLSWNPCNGQGFRYDITTNLEANKDFFFVGTQKYSGVNTTFSGSVASGPVELRVETDAANIAPGSTVITARCGTPGTIELNCNNSGCTSNPRPLPPESEAEVKGWNPCEGGPFSVSGNISLFESGRSSQDFLELGTFVFTGNREVKVDFPSAPIDVKIKTDVVGSSPSNGIDNLRVECGGVPRYEFDCSGRRCRSAADPLPGMMNAFMAWDPCDGRGFNYRGTIDTEEPGEGQDFVHIGNETYQGRNRVVQGRVAGPIELRTETDRFGDSRGIIDLVATCDSAATETP